MMTSCEFLQCILRNPVNAVLLERLIELSLPQCILTAGCLFQTRWNEHAGRLPDDGIKDYDIFYFNSDTSYESEATVIDQVDTVCRDLNVSVEVRNQARVHLWYYDKFRRDYPPLYSAHQGIDRFLMTACCVGVNIGSGTLYAPHGLQDMEDGILRMNPWNPQPDLFMAKAKDYRRRWTHLKIIT